MVKDALDLLTTVIIVKSYNSIRTSKHNIPLSSTYSTLFEKVKTNLNIYKKSKEILIIEIRITNQDCLHCREQHIRKYDLLANKLGQIYKSSTRIIQNYINQLKILPIFEMYIQEEEIKKLCTNK
ncbi:hypothetical protein NAPIS_ORF00619 [Vairimorpha apis BRL 01]|uniref:Uncharacterized protein n=1 Tax=Vairimorpha apis BRL 01 TaxID=1037528 RepID=T0LBZ2_9MICR|nr:hypothetical protein NAPIS_ORF00619 [Vairimorpha apis BRL 01]